MFICCVYFKNKEYYSYITMAYKYLSGPDKVKRQRKNNLEYPPR